MSKHELAAQIIQQRLKNGEAESKMTLAILKQNGIGGKTIQEVKAALGVKSYMKMRKWYWSMTAPEINAESKESTEE